MPRERVDGREPLAERPSGSQDPNGLGEASISTPPSRASNRCRALGRVGSAKHRVHQHAEPDLAAGNSHAASWIAHIVDAEQAAGVTRRHDHDHLVPRRDRRLRRSRRRRQPGSGRRSPICCTAPYSVPAFGIRNQRGTDRHAEREAAVRRLWEPWQQVARVRRCACGSVHVGGRVRKIDEDDHGLDAAARRYRALRIREGRSSATD